MDLADWEGMLLNPNPKYGSVSLPDKSLFGVSLSGESQSTKPGMEFSGTSCSEARDGISECVRLHPHGVSPPKDWCMGLGFPLSALPRSHSDSALSLSEDPFPWVPPDIEAQGIEISDGKTAEAT